MVASIHVTTKATTKARKVLGAHSNEEAIFVEVGAIMNDVTSPTFF